MSSDNYVRPFAVFFGILLVFYIIFKLWCKRRVEPELPVVHTHHAQVHAEAGAGAGAGAQQQQEVEHKGLNQETIDSYPTVVIGENGKMVDLDDKMCSICLCEYDENEILKILPECLHRFHRDCLDLWLKIDDTCPVCRTHPPRV